MTASSWSGIQSAVNTTVSQATERVAPVSRSVSSTSTRGRPWMAVTAVRVHSGARQRAAAPARKSANDWWRGSSVTMPTVRAPPWASVSRDEKLTCSAPTTSARADGALLQVDELLERAGRHHALRREPGTSRAERGRSRQPLARITVSASIVSRPPGPVSLERPPGDQPVTIVSVRSSAPARAASSA